MLTYSDVQTFVTTGLGVLGYGTSDKPALPALNPGPSSIQKLQKVSPNAIVFLNVGNGIVETMEGRFDRPFLTVRVIGTQNDFENAETLAHDLDRLFTEFQNGKVGNTRTLYFARNAPPQLVDLDESDRYHFQMTYVMETKR